MPRPQFLLGFVVFCTITPWILGDSIDDGNRTVETTTLSTVSDKTRRDEEEQYYEERAAGNVEEPKDDNENSPPKPGVSLRMLDEPLYPVEEFTDFQTEVPCDNAQFLLKILTVMLPLLRNEVPQRSRTSYILLILKELLESSPEAANDYEIHNKINDLILTLDKYHRDDDDISAALRKRTNVNGLPDGIQSKVVFQYEVPQLPNPSCTAEILHIVKVVQKAILKLVRNPLCHSIVPLEVPFFVNFEENYIKPELYKQSTDQYKIPVDWGDDNTDDVEQILISNNDQSYPDPKLQNLITGDVIYGNSDIIPNDIYSFLSKRPQSPTERPFKSYPYVIEDDFDLPNKIPANPKQIIDEIDNRGYSEYFDFFQLTTPSPLGIEPYDTENLFHKRPGTKYPEFIYPVKKNDRRKPKLSPININKYLDNIKIITNTDEPIIIDTTGEPQSAFIPLGPQNSDEIYYVTPRPKKNMPKYDKLPGTRPTINGVPDSVNTPRYPHNPYGPNWPYDTDSHTYKPILSVINPVTELPEMYVPRTESNIQFDIFGRPLRPIYPTTTKNPIDFDIFGRPKKPTYPYDKRPSHRPSPKGSILPDSPLDWTDDDTYYKDYPMTPDYDTNIISKSLDIRPNIPFIVKPKKHPYDNDLNVDYDKPEPNEDTWEQPNDSNNNIPYPDGKILQIIKDNIDVVVHKVPVRRLSTDLIKKITKLKELLDLEQITVEEYVNIINQYQIIIEKVKHMDIGNAIMKDLLLSITNLDKLDLLTGKSKVIEFTYLVKRPQPLIYQPYYYIKYRLPYTSFLLRTEKLLAENPQLTNHPAKLYKALIPISQVHETSPDLEAYGDDDILRLTFNDGTLVGAKVVKGKDIDMYKAIEQLKQINSELSVDDTYQLIKSLESKLKYTPEGLFVENRNIPGFNVHTQNPDEIRIKVNNQPILKKITKITTNKIGANRIISELLNKFNYLRSNGSDDTGNLTSIEKIDTLINNKIQPKSDILNSARSRDDYNSYIDEQLDSYKPAVPVDKYLQSVNVADLHPSLHDVSPENYTPEPLTPDELKWDPYPFSSDHTKQVIPDVKYIKLPSYEQSSYVYNPKDDDIPNSNIVDTETNDAQNLLRTPRFSSETYNDDSKEKSLRQLETQSPDGPLGVVHNKEFIMLPEPHLTTTLSEPNKDSQKLKNEKNDLRKPYFTSTFIIDRFHNKTSKEKPFSQIYESERSYVESPWTSLSRNEYLNNPDFKNSLISHSATYISKPNEESNYGVKTNIPGTEIDDTQSLLSTPLFNSQTMINPYYNNESQTKTVGQMYDTEYETNSERSNPHLISHSKTYINGIPVEHTKTYNNIQSDLDDVQFRNPTLSQKVLEDNFIRNQKAKIKGRDSGLYLKNIQGNLYDVPEYQNPNIFQNMYKDTIKVNENNDQYLKKPSLGHVVKGEFINSPNIANLQLVKHSQSYVNGYPVEHTKTYVTNDGSNHIENFIKSSLDAEKFNMADGLQSVVDKESLLENYKPVDKYKNGMETLISKNSILENYKPIDNFKNGIETSINKGSLIQNVKSVDDYNNMGTNFGSETGMFDANANSMAQSPGYVNNQFVAGNFYQDQGNIGSNMEQNLAYNGQTYSSRGPYIGGNNYNEKNGIETSINKGSLLQDVKSVDDYNNMDTNFGPETTMYDANANSMAQSPGYVNNQFAAGKFNQDQGNIGSNMEQNQAYNGQTYSSGGSYIGGNNYNNNLVGLTSGYGGYGSSGSIGGNLGTSYRYISNQKPVFGPVVRKVIRHQLFG